MIDLEKLKTGDRRTLAKAITLIESSRENDQIHARELLNKVISLPTKSFRIGITGSPGVGKSTFIEHFGQYLVSQKHKVAVLAIDPSSPTSGGSILGDKTRMEKLANEENAFIRPTPASGALGGVAQKTRETILLCEAAGYDYVLVETVGVGQSEYEVANMVDFFMLLILPNGGDELQGIKKGILELADSIVINKADGDSLNLAKQTQAQYQSALQITTHSSFWKTEVILNSSLNANGFDELYKMLNSFKSTSEQNHEWDKKRQEQNVNWFNSLLKEIILRKITSNNFTNNKLIELNHEVLMNTKTPLDAAYEIADLLELSHGKSRK
ncbi:MAG: methylmalonyl Co-A mutase-associated GTPase MeaB [Bacteriovoracaceae bacterium]|nr:methylmalonyl Co-A mutase-associated GTPase MeaB [Bacteriovoracaceae bacterium]